MTKTVTQDNDNAGFAPEFWAYAGPRFDERDRKLYAYWYPLDGADDVPAEAAKCKIFKHDTVHKRLVVGHVYKLSVQRHATGGVTVRFKNSFRENVLADADQARSWQISATAAEAVNARARNDDKAKRDSRSYDPDNRLEPWRAAWTRARSHHERHAIELQLLAALRDLPRK